MKSVNEFSEDIHKEGGLFHPLQFQDALFHGCTMRGYFMGCLAASKDIPSSSYIPVWAEMIRAAADALVAEYSNYPPDQAKTEPETPFDYPKEAQDDGEIDRKYYDPGATQEPHELVEEAVRFTLQHVQKAMEAGLTTFHPDERVAGGKTASEVLAVGFLRERGLAD